MIFPFSSINTMDVFDILLTYSHIPAMHPVNHDILFSSMHHLIRWCKVINQGAVHFPFLMFLHRRLASSQLPKNGNIGTDADSHPLHTLFVS